MSPLVHISTILILGKHERGDKRDEPTLWKRVFEENKNILLWERRWGKKTLAAKDTRTFCSFWQTPPENTRHVWGIFEATEQHDFSYAYIQFVHHEEALIVTLRRAMGHKESAKGLNTNWSPATITHMENWDNESHSGGKILQYIYVLQRKRKQKHWRSFCSGWWSGVVLLKLIQGWDFHLNKRLSVLEGVK